MSAVGIGFERKLDAGTADPAAGSNGVPKLGLRPPGAIFGVSLSLSREGSGFGRGLEFEVESVADDARRFDDVAGTDEDVEADFA